MSGRQFRHWAAALSAGLGRAFGNPTICLAIQAQLPAFAPAGPQPGPAHRVPRAGKGAPQTGVPA